MNKIDEAFQQLGRCVVYRKDIDALKYLRHAFNELEDRATDTQQPQGETDLKMDSEKSASPC